jgi:hypothetical protein
MCAVESSLSAPISVACRYAGRSDIAGLPFKASLVQAISRSLLRCCIGIPLPFAPSFCDVKSCPQYLRLCHAEVRLRQLRLVPIFDSCTAAYAVGHKAPPQSLKLRSGAPGGIAPRRPLSRDVCYLSPPFSQQESGLRSRAQHEVVVRELGDLPPQIRVVAECHDRLPDLLVV